MAGVAGDRKSTVSPRSPGLDAVSEAPLRHSISPRQVDALMREGHVPSPPKFLLRGEGGGAGNMRGSVVSDAESVRALSPGHHAYSAGSPSAPNSRRSSMGGGAGPMPGSPVVEGDVEYPFPRGERRRSYVERMYGHVVPKVESNRSPRRENDGAREDSTPTASDAHADGDNAAVHGSGRASSPSGSPRLKKGTSHMRTRTRTRTRTHSHTLHVITRLLCFSTVQERDMAAV